MDIDTAGSPIPHSSHWGAFSVVREGDGVRILPHPRDPDPAVMLGNLPAALTARARIAMPMVRRGYLERGPGPDRQRGREDFVPVSWHEALGLAAGELQRVYAHHGGKAVFGGSYGWSSAGRFHHAQSQVHRFLNALGGYVKSVNTYSSAAAAVILPHVIGSQESAGRENVSWHELATQTEMVLAFGGLPLKNTSVSSGGTSQHIARDHLAAAYKRGTKFHLISPIQDDLPLNIEPVWHPIRPGTDVALMLGIAHTLVAEDLHDIAFLERYCVGYPAFEAYLTGRSDGQPKTAAWAAAICQVPVETIQVIARQAAGRRTLITCAQSLQRAEHGEQPVWMGVVLAAMLGQIGLPGGGFVYAMGSLSNVGKPALAVPLPTLPQGQNRVPDLIPVARIADLLLNPGQEYDFNGRRLTYPDIRLVYWAGGNPFHHHQDINRLREAFARPDTIVVHDSAWTATARHADIVFPATVTMERADMGASANDPLLVAMHPVAAPFGQARDDYAIFADLAERLGVGPAFTEGRDAEAWLRHLYEPTRAALLKRGDDAPDFDTFWARGELTLPTLPWDGGVVRAFRNDPDQRKLPTPTGMVEVASATIASYGYDDCPGHPVWLPPAEGVGSPIMREYPLHLISNQPATRLHSQLDFGAASLASKIQGREPVRIHPTDAAARDIANGDIVRLFNHRGACLAGAVVSKAVRPGVVQLATGAWYDPIDPTADSPLCVHGNPNVLTRDAGTSRLAQACTGQLTVVEVERYRGPLPPIRAFDPPDQ
ncbi:MAG TPA: Asp-tRNA(Asn)/Glu-tRNA(Gln) amidotransferase GatCAB subunit C [Acetobacteraceae bacterium]|jgi:biotin/methionine sulfoxide reductase|nr:Asp-tRNA(Asn)/Glu-tRNA(Gln) amidotransferase GatCAB subunit C [Acetobacteraceae bacterium]